MVSWKQVVCVGTCVVACGTLGGVAEKVKGFRRTLPRLDGRHMRITVITQEEYVDFNETTGTYSGYLIRMLERVAAKANFTYDILPPSGRGSVCMHPNDEATAPYDPYYRGQYICGESDVTDLPHTNYTTDMYLGLYYITPARLKKNDFTMAFHPPITGSITLVGTATHIHDVTEYIEKQQSEGFKPICVKANTAYFKYLETNFPNARFLPIPDAESSFYRNLMDRKCDVMAMDYTGALRFVQSQHSKDQCHFHGKPVGLIDVFPFGFNNFAFGIRSDLPMEIKSTWDFWLTTLMACNPDGVSGSELCDGAQDSLSGVYDEVIGHSYGTECDYEQFPKPDNRLLARRHVVLIVVGGFIMLISIAVGGYYWRSARQRRRYKKRFVQQIARNIKIGPSPRLIPPDKLASAIAHIGNGARGTITKEELSKWMEDIKLSFLSKRDFDALWNAMDIDRKGVVNAIEFIMFLSCCGDEFEEVYREQSRLPRSERLKLAARRLENFEDVGEEGVRKIENKIERSTRLAIHVPTQESPRMGNPHWKAQIKDVSNALEKANDGSSEAWMEDQQSTSLHTMLSE